MNMGRLHKGAQFKIYLPTFSPPSSKRYVTQRASSNKKLVSRVIRNRFGLYEP